MIRKDNRLSDQLRALSVAYDVFPYAVASTQFSLGNTTVLSSIMLQQGVPPFLKGQKRGWLTADYTMLPAATPNRTARESVLGKKNGRSVEISRLLGRSLRAVTNLDIIGEHTIFIDCDIVCADGGTRVAALCGAFMALKAADQFWQHSGFISQSILTDELVALSVGIIDDTILLDLTCEEDNMAQADFNFVLGRNQAVVEVQGGAEESPIGREDFAQVIEHAFVGSKQLFEFYDAWPYQPGKKTSISCPPKTEL